MRLSSHLVLSFFHPNEVNFCCFSPSSYHHIVIESARQMQTISVQVEKVVCSLFFPKSWGRVF